MFLSCLSFSFSVKTEVSLMSVFSHLTCKYMRFSQTGIWAIYNFIRNVPGRIRIVQTTCYNKLGAIASCINLPEQGVNTYWRRNISSRVYTIMGYWTDNTGLWLKGNTYCWDKTPSSVTSNTILSFQYVVKNTYHVTSIPPICIVDKEGSADPRREKHVLGEWQGEE